MLGRAQPLAACQLDPLYAAAPPGVQHDVPAEEPAARAGIAHLAAANPLAVLRLHLGARLHRTPGPSRCTEQVGRETFHTPAQDDLGLGLGRGEQHELQFRIPVAAWMRWTAYLRCW